MTSQPAALGGGARMKWHLITRSAVQYALTLAAVVVVVACATDVTETSLPPSGVSSISFVASTPNSVPTQRAVNFEVELRDARQNPLQQVTVDWSTSNPSVLQLVQRVQGMTALFQPLAAGTAVITATVGALHTSITVTVRPPGKIARLTVSDVPPQLLGTTYQLQWTARDADETLLPPVMPRFESSDTAVLRVGTTGLVTTVAEGLATINAVVDGKIAERGISVLAGEHAFLWTEATGMTDLGVPEGFVTSRAQAISVRGQVVGSASSIGGSAVRAVSWTPGATGGVRVLQTLVNSSRSEAFAVNSRGQIAGYGTGNDGKRHAILWSADGAVQDLGTLPNSAESVALGLNDAGDVVGWSGPHAFVWTQRDGMRALGNWQQSVATAISNTGAIVGIADNAPFATNSTGPFQLRLVTGKGIALSVNNAGESVGVVSECLYNPLYDESDCSDISYLRSAGAFWIGESVFRWLTSDGLATKSGDFAKATGINNRRQVVGTDLAGLAMIAGSALAANNNFEAARMLGTLERRRYSAPAAINDVGQVVGWSGNRPEVAWSGTWQTVGRSGNP